MSESNKNCTICKGETALREDLPEHFGWAGLVLRCPECQGYYFSIGEYPDWYKPFREKEIEEARQREQERIREKISDPSRLP